MKTFLSAVLAVGTSVPAIAQDNTDQVSATVLAQAIEKAEAAREEARVAMEKAEKALQALEGLRPHRAAPQAALTAATDDESSGAEQKLAAGLSAECVSDLATLSAKELALQNPNCFTHTKLGMIRGDQYETADVALKSSVQAVDDNFEVVGSYTWRYAPVSEGSRSSYYTFKVGGYAAKGSGGSAATIYDFDDVQSGAGVILGLEYGSHKPFASGKRAEIVEKGIAQARKDCVEAKMLTVSDDRISTNYAEAVKQCSGPGVWEWVRSSGNGKTYWGEILERLYRADRAFPDFAAGITLRYGSDRQKWLTEPILASLPAGSTFEQLDGLRDKGDFRPFSIKGSLGFALNRGEAVKQLGRWGSDYARQISVGTVFSGTYKREYEYPDDAGDQLIGLTDGVVTRSKKYNIAAPVKVEEFIPSAQLNLLFPRYGWFPDVGLSAKINYGTQTDRIALDVPLYVSADSDGNLTGGVKYFYRSSGTAADGRTLESEKGVGIFIGTKFNLLSGR